MPDHTLDSYNWSRYEITESGMGIMFQLITPNDEVMDTRIFREIYKLKTLLVIPGQPFVFELDYD